MGKNCHKIGRCEGILVAFAVLASASLVSCRDWPDERSTTIEAQNILRDLGRIETIPDPNVQGPSIYKSPPKKIKQIVGGGEEWKLIYFCRCHTAEEMKQIINEQFATKLFDEKGKSANVNDYTVTANVATNQLIVRCPLEADIDAVMEIIKEIDIPPIQVRIDCMVSELYADLTVDRETSMAIKNLFGEGITLGGQEDNGDLAFPGAELRDPARAKFGLKVGVNQNHFKALVDVLVSRGYMKILMNPSLEIVNGETAKIQSKQHQPLQQITVQSGGYGGVPVLSTQTEYYEVIDSLQITPHVYAEGYIGMETTAQIAAYLTPEGIKQTPIVTERTITNKDNRIRLGESLVIGGIRKSEKRDVIRGVPILKDIPAARLALLRPGFRGAGHGSHFHSDPQYLDQGQAQQGHGGDAEGPARLAGEPGPLRDRHGPAGHQGPPGRRGATIRESPHRATGIGGGNDGRPPASHPDRPAGRGFGGRAGKEQGQDGATERRDPTGPGPSQASDGGSPASQSRAPENQRGKDGEAAGSKAEREQERQAQGRAQAGRADATAAPGWCPDAQPPQQK